MSGGAHSGLPPRPDRVQRLVELDLRDRAVRVVEHPEARRARRGGSRPHPSRGSVDTPSSRSPWTVGDHGLPRAGGVGCRHPHELEIQGSVVVEDEQHVLAVDHGVRRVVLDALAARPHHARLGAQVGGIHEPFLARDRRADPDDEVAVAAGEARADPVPLVGLVEQLRVVGDGRAELVQPDRVGSPRVVDGRVDDEPAVGRERRARERVRDLVGELLAGDEVAHAHGVALVARDVDAVEHAACRRSRPRSCRGRRTRGPRPRRCRRAGPARRARRRRARARAASSRPARRAARGTGCRTACPRRCGRSTTSRRGATGTERSVSSVRPLISSKIASAKAREVRRALLGVGVLGLEVRDDRRILLRPEPLVRVLDVVAVMAADDRRAGGDGRGGGDASVVTVPR